MEESQVKLFCWNVAGLTSTVGIIDSLMGPSQTFLDYLDRLGADVVCIQEAKIPESRLREEPWAAGACKKGGDQRQWESYWAYAMKNWNGVVTFARQGLVHRATNKIFGVDELDREGRCVVTYFSEFTLFNVYVPNARQGQRSQYRAKFVSALREAMHKVRAESGKPVILAGDLNMTYRAADCAWSSRRIDLARFTALQGEAVDAWLPRATRRVMLDAMLAWMKWAPLGPDVPVGAELPHVMDRIRFALDHHAERQRDAMDSPASLEDTDARNPAKDEMEDGPVHPEYVWVEPFLPKASEPSAAQNLNWYKAVTLAGLPAHSPDAERMLGKWLIAEDGMIDIFRVLIPDLRCRFTAFSQLQNGRYHNEGRRIDYFLVDPVLAPKVSPLTTDDADEKRLEVGLSEFNGALMRDALSALTAGGRFQPAPFSGDGMQPLSRGLLELQFDGEFKTGFVYTAPQLSDHIALRLVLALPRALSKRVDGRPPTVTRDAATKQCQFRPSQRGVLDMFARASAAKAITAEEPRKKTHRPESTLLTCSATASQTLLLDAAASQVRRQPSGGASSLDEVVVISDDD